MCTLPTFYMFTDVNRGPPSKTCYDSFYTFVNDYANTLVTVSVSTLVVMLLIPCFVCCLCCSSGKDKTQKILEMEEPLLEDQRI